MTKIYIKLIAMALALVLSVSVVVMSSYAWLVLAGNPVATGIQVAIGGGNTILTAPNIRTVDEDGTVHNYPGYFSDKLNFGQQDNYEYLQGLGNLTPVSTVNGVDWFLPAYYSGNDQEVQEGKIPSGALKDISQFQWDGELSYANLDKEKDQNKIDKGSYIYLDFWVVAPGGDYYLRVSTGVEELNGGSFVIDLMEPKQENGSYTLKLPKGSAAAAVRVGFLANDLTIVDDTMQRYIDSRYSDERFTSLRGLYQEPNTGTAYLLENRFTIYEPNGDYHPGSKQLNGSYVETKPLGFSNDQITEQRTKDNLTVQGANTWAPAVEGTEGTALEQRFKTALFAGIWEKMNADAIMNSFYGNYLQGVVAPYVRKGSFAAKTQNLYALLGEGSKPVSQSELEKNLNAGATDDVYIIKLERNVPQRVRMFIWLEGQDMDCVDSVNSARFAVNVELAGGSE